MQRHTPTPTSPHANAHGQRGAAMVVALLVVAAVAAVSIQVMWKQWQGWQLERHDRTASQLHWLMLGGTDWARLLMRIDAQSGSADHLAEPWTIEIKEARLSSFLVSQGQSVAPELDTLATQTLMWGRIQDATSKLNARNLIADAASGRPDANAVRAFKRLYLGLGLDPERVDALVETLANWMRSPNDAQTPHGVPMHLSQWQMLGWTPQEQALLSPYVVWLPKRTPVNLNTAPLPVLAAVLDGPNPVQAAREVVAERERRFLESMTDATNRLPGVRLSSTDARYATESGFFWVMMKLTMDDIPRQAQVLLERQGQDLTVVGWLPMPMMEAAAWN